jgi:hypothetical protein
MDLPPKSARICVAAQKLAERTPGFFEIKGHGLGDRATNAYMRDLREILDTRKGQDCEVPVSKGIDSKFDFFVADEKCVVEIALGLHNPNCEFEKDILKCLLAREEGVAIETLVLVGKPGTLIKQAEPYRAAVADLCRRRYGLEIVVLELQRSQAATMG